jgi:hypothetical protein
LPIDDYAGRLENGPLALNMENSLLQTRPVDASPGWWSGGFRSLFRWLIASQIRLTREFDDILPSRYLIDGNADFVDRLVPQYTPAGAIVYDVGGGKNPLIGAECKAHLGLRITGLDIDAGELAAAPLAGCGKTPETGYDQGVLSV